MVYISFEVATLPVCVPLTKGMFRIAIVWNLEVGSTVLEA